MQLLSSTKERTFTDANSNDSSTWSQPWNAIIIIFTFKMMSPSNGRNLYNFFYLFHVSTLKRIDANFLNICIHSDKTTVLTWTSFFHYFSPPFFSPSFFPFYSHITAAQTKYSGNFSTRLNNLHPWLYRSHQVFSTAPGICSIFMERLLAMGVDSSLQTHSVLGFANTSTLSFLSISTTCLENYNYKHFLL